jgi:hypothetical protein
MDINFTPPPTVKRMMRSNAQSRWIKGPVGSAKTTGMIFEVVRRAIETPPMEDGIRRSRWLVTRLTMPQLKDTVLKSWLRWFPDGKMGYWRSQDSTYWLKFNDVEAEVMFRPLESEADVARVLSLELTGAWVAECRDLPVSMISDIKGRCGRFPDPKIPYWYGVFGETNPPAEGSDWYKVFEKLPQEEGNEESIVDCEVFSQPCPVNDDFTLRPDAENIENLKPTYYQDLAKGANADYIRVFIKGEYGRNRKGQPVYLDSFQRALHVSKTPLPIDAHAPIIIGMDFGLTPAAIIAQPDPHKPRLNLLREVVTPKGSTNGVEQFTMRRLKPFLRSYFPSNPIIIICDPSNTRSESDEKTAIKVLKAQGFLVKRAKTNDPLVRINAVETLLTMFPYGEPMIQVDPSMKVLIEGFLFGYMFAAARTGEVADKPFKNCIWSHPHDGLQYLCLYYNDGYDADDWRPVSENPLYQSQGYRPADNYAGY